MGFRTKNYATVWDIREGRGNTLQVRISTSRKIKDTDEYEQDFSGYCSFIGHAKAKAEKLKVRDRIRLGDVDVTTWYNKETGKEYVTYKVFDFDMADGSSEGKTAEKSSGASKKKTSGLEDAVEDGDVDEDNLPF